VGLTVDHMPTETSEVGFYPIGGATGITPISALPVPLDTVGGGGGPSVEASGACGTVVLEASYISPTATRWDISIYSVTPVEYATDVKITYDVGNKTGSTYFDPRGLDYFSTSPTIEAYQKYGDVSADFNGWVYDTGIGWCYFNTPELYYGLNS